MFSSFFVKVPFSSCSHPSLGLLLCGSTCLDDDDDDDDYNYNGDDGDGDAKTLICRLSISGLLELQSSLLICFL